jgi:hypothetical protein
MARVDDHGTMRAFYQGLDHEEQAKLLRAGRKWVSE